MTSQKKAITALFRPLSSKSSRSRKHLAADDNPALEGIWHVVCAIPRGRVSTYGAVARAAGLPWHRVVGAGGRIVFPRSSREHKEQARRLHAEGVLVQNGRVTPAAITDLEEL